MLQSIPRRPFSAAVLVGTLAAATTAAAADPLPSWNEGVAKNAILQFVARVTKEGGPDFVPVVERIATFDNDGTLRAEQPMPCQLAFALDRVKALAPQHPEWRHKEPFASVLKGDLKAALADGDPAVLEVLMATHAGVTIEDFRKTVTDWMAAARHPVSGRLYTEMVYQPMLELLAYLRANGFKTFIVSGGGARYSAGCRRASRPCRRRGRLPAALATLVCRRAARTSARRCCR